MKLLPPIFRWRSAVGRPDAVVVALIAALVAAAHGAPVQNANSIVNSKHNLSVSSPGRIHAATESDICIFCHTPHFASGDGPLWNHKMSSAVYRPYSSSTLKAVVGQPTGASRLCLSCHDGTVAMGTVHSRGADIAMNTPLMPSGSDKLGVDLSADHPVSFVYDHGLAIRDGNLRDPKTLPSEVKLDRGSQLQCTACHDPHNNQYGDFLVMDNSGSALCVACHSLANWTTSAHALSGAPLPAALVSALASAQPTTPQTTQSQTAQPRTVASAACAGCHVPHAAGSKEELTRMEAPEQNCEPCHSSQGPGRNLAAEFGKVSVHPIYVNSEAHSSAENLVNPPVRHVTCVDCHNPHAATKSAGSQAHVSGALAGVAGISAGGAALQNVSHEYELCFRCHGDSAQRGPAVVSRQHVETDTRRQFNPGNISYHPVEAIGKNSQSPSLVRPLTVSSLVNCTDCHNNDQGPGAGGNGPSGPHGSAFSPLLERQLLLTDGTPYNQDNFALCFKCHSPMTVDSQLPTSWAYHQQHIETYRAACTTCHDSHGATQPHLVNFNTTYVLPFNGVLRYTSTGLNHGNCTLTCHDGNGQNHTHNNLAY